MAQRFFQIVTAVGAVGVVFSASRFILSSIVFHVFRRRLRHYPLVASWIALLITGSSITAAVEVFHAAYTRWFGEVALSVLAIAVAPLVLLLLLRLLGSATSELPDPAAYDSEWLPDPTRSDEWNPHERLRIESQLKAWSFLGLVFGTTIVLELWQNLPAQPSWMIIATAYLLAGVTITVLNLGQQMIGAAGLVPTLFFGVVAWPVFLGMRLNEWI